MNELRRESPRIDVETLCWEMIDGREAVQFLVGVKERIEAPERLVLEV